MFEKLMGRVRPEFVSSLMEYARNNKKPEIDRIDIANSKFYDEGEIAKLFLSKGRIVKHIDTTTFRNKVVVAVEGGEVWSARFNLAGPSSTFVIRLTEFELAQLEQKV